MSFNFEISITTAKGNARWNQRANSFQQINEQMPDEVQIYELTIVPRSSKPIVVDDAELRLDLSSTVCSIATVYLDGLGGTIMNKIPNFDFGKADLGHTIVVGPTSAGLTTFPQRLDGAAVTKVFSPVKHDAASFAFMRLTNEEFDKIKGASGDTKASA